MKHNVEGDGLKKVSYYQEERTYAFDSFVSTV